MTPDIVYANSMSTFLEVSPVPNLVCCHPCVLLRVQPNVTDLTEINIPENDMMYDFKSSLISPVFGFVRKKLLFH